MTSYELLAEPFAFRPDITIVPYHTTLRYGNLNSFKTSYQDTGLKVIESLEKCGLLTSRSFLPLFSQKQNPERSLKSTLSRMVEDGVLEQLKIFHQQRLASTAYRLSKTFGEVSGIQHPLLTLDELCEPKQICQWLPITTTAACIYDSGYKFKFFIEDPTIPYMRASHPFRLSILVTSFRTGQNPLRFLRAITDKLAGRLNNWRVVVLFEDGIQMRDIMNDIFIQTEYDEIPGLYCSYDAMLFTDTPVMYMINRSIDGTLLYIPHKINHISAVLP